MRNRGTVVLFLLLVAGGAWLYLHLQRGIGEVQSTIAPSDASPRLRPPVDSYLDGDRKQEMRMRYDLLRRSIRAAMEKRKAAGAATVPAANPSPAKQPAARPYSPDDMPIPDSDPNPPPAPSKAEQKAWLDAVNRQLDPLVDDCVKELPTPPKGVLNLVWVVIQDEDVGAVAERVEFDEITEVRDEQLLACVRESIFSVQLPTMKGFGELQVTWNHDFSAPTTPATADAPADNGGDPAP